MGTAGLLRRVRDPTEAGPDVASRATRAFLGGRGGTKGRPELEVRDKKGQELESRRGIRRPERICLLPPCAAEAADVNARRRCALPPGPSCTSATSAVLVLPSPGRSSRAARPASKRPTSSAWQCRWPTPGREPTPRRLRAWSWSPPRGSGIVAAAASGGEPRDGGAGARETLTSAAPRRGPAVGRRRIRC